VPSTVRVGGVVGAVVLVVVVEVVVIGAVGVMVGVVGAMVGVGVAVVAFVPVLVGAVADVGSLPPVATWDWLTAFGVAAVLGVVGSTGVDGDADAGADAVVSSERALAFSDPLDVNTVAGAIVDGNAPERSPLGVSSLGASDEDGVLLLEGTGTVGPLATAGALSGEAGSRPRYTKSDTIPTAAAIPVPHCRRRTFAADLDRVGRWRFAPWCSDITDLSTQAATNCCIQF
jgi:hypothetical protein